MSWSQCNAVREAFTARPHGVSLSGLQALLPANVCQRPYQEAEPRRRLVSSVVEDVDAVVWMVVLGSSRLQYVIDVDHFSPGFRVLASLRGSTSYRGTLNRTKYRYIQHSTTRDHFNFAKHWFCQLSIKMTTKKDMRRGDLSAYWHF